MFACSSVVASSGPCIDGTPAGSADSLFTKIRLRGATEATPTHAQPGGACDPACGLQASSPWRRWWGVGDLLFVGRRSGVGRGDRCSWPRALDFRSLGSGPLGTAVTGGRGHGRHHGQRHQRQHAPRGRGLRRVAMKAERAMRGLDADVTSAGRANDEHGGLLGELRGAIYLRDIAMRRTKMSRFRSCTSTPRASPTGSSISLFRKM